MQITEDIEHALFSCKNVKELPEKVLTHLKIKNLTLCPVTASQIILYDKHSSAKTLINVVWMLLLSFILNNRLNKAPNNAEKIARKIKDIIIFTNTTHPNRDLAREARRLELTDFLASHEIGHPIHWTTFQPISKI